jgi:flavin-binding protein dodecin
MAVSLTKELHMSDHHTYKKIDLVGSSTIGVDDAIKNAIAEAAKSIDHMEWFEVTETRGHIQEGKVMHFQVTLKVGFRISNS